MQPRRTSSFGEDACTSSPSNTIAPLVTSPRSECSRLEMALSVVVLPAPLAPSKATMCPRGTSSETPLSTRMTWSYTTSMLLRERMVSCAAAGCGEPAFWAIDTRTSLASPRTRGEAARRSTASHRPAIIASRRLVAGLRPLRPGRVLGYVVLGGGFQHRTHFLLHGRDPVGHLDPLGAVPLLHVG